MRHDEAFGGNKAFTKAGLAVGTTTTITIANTVQFAIKGKSYSKSAASNAATPTTDAVTGNAFTAITAGKAGVFTVCLDSTGAIKVIQGQIVDLVGGAIGHAPQYGPDSNDLAPIGSVLVKCATGAAAWTFGSSNLAGPPSNVTFTITDWADGVPPRPQA